MSTAISDDTLQRICAAEESHFPKNDRRRKKVRKELKAEVMQVFDAARLLSEAQFNNNIASG
jgi:hypothetical protein